MNIYVASSWRNAYQPEVVARLRSEGHSVYDFRNPSEAQSGFHWSDIDPDWQRWSPNEYAAALGTPLAELGFRSDYTAVARCDALVMVLPCGRSAHLEAGLAAGFGKPAYAYLPEMIEPELMYKMFMGVSDDLDVIVDWLALTDQASEIPE